MKARLKLVKSSSLPDFPSGSSINFQHGKLFLIGDDSSHMLELDPSYAVLGSHKLFDFAEKRIPKAVKADLETSNFITIRGAEYLMILGSASTANREKIFLVPFRGGSPDIPHFQIIHSEAFTTRLRVAGVAEVNIEGSAVIGDHLLLSNRGNRKNSTNYIVVTAVDFWARQASANIHLIPVDIPAVAEDIPGISELCYVPELDLLLVTLSSERTDNAYDDGSIGDSYLGWIENISHNLQTPFLKIDTLINLSIVHQDFKHEKIEGMCVEAVLNGQITLHLMSDNDNGESKIFKVSMTLKS